MGLRLAIYYLGGVESTILLEYIVRLENYDNHI